MSYTTNVKNEILNMEYHESELISELSAIININGTIKKNSISLYTENIGVSRRIYKPFIMSKKSKKINHIPH